MRITMICIGSTGDVRPYIVLGRELKRRGHDVKIAAFDTFEQAVKKEGMRFHAISGDVRDFMATVMSKGANGVAFLRQVRNSLVDIIDPFLEDLEAACEDAEALIGTFSARFSSRWRKCATSLISRPTTTPWIATKQLPLPPHPGSGWARRGTI